MNKVKRNKDKNEIKFALIQSGYCVFGVGNTREECLDDAAKCLEPDENGYFDSDRIENELLTTDSVNGAFYILKKNDEEFDDYLKNQGCYIQKNGEWYNE